MDRLRCEPMMAAFPWLLFLHVCGDLVWIGSTAACGFLLGRDPRAARFVFTRLVNPAWIVAFLAGAAMLGSDFQHYMHQHWMHGKLTVALIAIGLTHVLGARARRQSEASSAANPGGTADSAGSRQPDAVGANLTIAFLVCAVLAVAFVTALRQYLT